MGEPNLQEIHDFLLGLAQKAGTMIISANPSTTAKSGRLTDSPTFVVDPIDGTTNFVHAHPYISISLAFAHKQKPLVGVVYNPFTQHLYTAIKGQGAFLTAPTIPASFPSPGTKVESTYEKRKLPLRSPPPALPDLSHAIVGVEYGNERLGNNWDCKISTFSTLGRDKSIDGAMVQSVRSLGSAALNMCSVARGDIDVYWEGGCWAWDVAAGWVIVEEAGGLVVGGNKGEWTPKVDGRRYLVLRAGAGKEVVEEFWSKINAAAKTATKPFYTMRRGYARDLIFQHLVWLCSRTRRLGAASHSFPPTIDKTGMMFILVLGFLFLFSILPLSLPSPTSTSPTIAARLPQARRSLPCAHDVARPLRRFQPRTTISDLLASYPSIATADLFISAPPPVSSYRFFLTSYHFHPADHASVALSSFYAAIASRSSSLGARNEAIQPALAFGAGRLWINFYGTGGQALAWKDLEWVAVKCRGWAERGFVGTWTGVLRPPERDEAVVVQVKVLA
ncbi:MAG: hypothetical protein Q9211_004985 [Gyalolechia sp. 1 TL-2023]